MGCDVERSESLLVTPSKPAFIKKKEINRKTEEKIATHTKLNSTYELKSDATRENSHLATINETSNDTTLEDKAPICDVERSESLLMTPSKSAFFKEKKINRKIDKKILKHSKLNSTYELKKKTHDTYLGVVVSNEATLKWSEFFPVTLSKSVFFKEKIDKERNHSKLNSTY